jgi:NADP-dependent 3-hydroxy acid dehydrogenase YdfG
VLPGEVATPILEKRPVPPSQEERARMLQAEDLGKTLLFIATLPARACVNEILVSPTWNRFYLGGLEKPK